MIKPPARSERWGDIVGGPYTMYRFFICVRARITSRMKGVAGDSCGLWTMDTGQGRLQLYVTCPSCLWINNISDHYVENSGRISSECAVCPKCHIHFFPELIGWRSSFGKKIGYLVPTRTRKEG